MSDMVKGALIGASATLGAALITALVGHSAGFVYIGPSPAPSSTSATGSSSAHGASAGPKSLLPPGVTVRRQTGNVPIKLKVGYGVDLDDNVSPNWSAKFGPAGSSAGYGSDIVYEGTTGLGADGLEFNQDAALENGSVGYATCAEETGYFSDSISVGDLENDLRAGKKICVRTSQNRYALITLVSVSTSQLVVSATVWDPQFASQ